MFLFYNHRFSYKVGKAGMAGIVEALNRPRRALARHKCTKHHCSARAIGFLGSKNLVHIYVVLLFGRALCLVGRFVDNRPVSIRVRLMVAR
jgi:hypothetical protein